MREILFRGKRTDNGEWVQGDLVHSQYKIGDTCVGQYGNTVGIHQVDHETVGQYTCLTDKNGKKIFEGDIVWDEYQEAYAEIRYDEDTAMFLILFDSWCTDFDHYASIDIEVVGNIHDNPELLKGVNDNG